jgi:hypothetical protein
MRFKLLCAIATTLPSTSEATDSTTSICCHSGASPLMPSTSRRIVIAKAANSGAPPIIKVTAVGAPW